VRNQVLVQLAPEASVRESVRLMAERHIGAVVVMKEGRLAGIFTERDMLNRVAAEGRNPDTTLLSDVMTRDPRTIEDSARSIEALRAMQNGGFRHLPVTRRGKLAGILSLRDFASVELAEIEREGDFERAIAEGGAPHN
jgi:CBS domain-containing protein